MKSHCVSAIRRTSLGRAGDWVLECMLECEFNQTRKDVVERASMPDMAYPRILGHYYLRMSSLVAIRAMQPTKNPGVYYLDSFLSYSNGRFW